MKTHLLSNYAVTISLSSTAGVEVVGNRIFKKYCTNITPSALSLLIRFVEMSISSVSENVANPVSGERTELPNSCTAIASHYKLRRVLDDVWTRPFSEVWFSKLSRSVSVTTSTVTLSLFLSFLQLSVRMSANDFTTRLILSMCTFLWSKALKMQQRSSKCSLLCDLF